MRYVFLMSAAERSADDVSRQHANGWPEDSPTVAVVDPGLPLHDPDVAATVTVEGTGHRSRRPSGAPV